MHRVAIVAAILIAATVLVSAAKPLDLGTDLHGQPVSELAGRGVHVVVLIFAASDCPISNRYIPEIAQLTKEFTPQGVRFWWVYPNGGDSGAIVEQHIRDFSITGESLLDARQALVSMAHASVTPESAVFAVERGALVEVYHGRIDDRYISLGQERPQAQHHDLEMAISAAVAGKPVPQPGGPPVGCSIVFLQK
ncbi:MAG: redoxin domain-containing protein [Terracidiphilus sp.]|jgi:hypothetical protein